MPPVKLSLSDKLKYCDSYECIEKLVDEYLRSLVNKDENIKFSFLDNELDEDDDKIIANSYRFSEALIQKLMLIDIDPEFIIRDLEYRLGKTHPVVIFLKHLTEE
ncbi:MAG: hypothetical protein QXV69_01845 [Sulfolobaceae archaeon]